MENQWSGLGSHRVDSLKNNLIDWCKSPFWNVMTTHHFHTDMAWYDIRRKRMISLNWNKYPHPDCWLYKSSPLIKCSFICGWQLMKWPLLDCVRALNQLFFLGSKLLTLRKRAAENISSSVMSSSQMSSCLPQASQQVSMAANGSVISSPAYALNPLVWHKLCGVVSSMLWPLLARTIMEGKHLIEDGRHEVLLSLNP